MSVARKGAASHRYPSSSRGLSCDQAGPPAVNDPMSVYLRFEPRARIAPNRAPALSRRIEAMSDTVAFAVACPQLTPCP